MGLFTDYSLSIRMINMFEPETLKSLRDDATPMYGKYRIQARKLVFHEVDLIFATTATAAVEEFKKVLISLVIIDKASNMTETKTKAFQVVCKFRLTVLCVLLNGDE